MKIVGACRRPAMAEVYGTQNKYQNNGDAKDESRGGFCVYKNGVHQTCYGAKCGS
jgi:hypothetical protein